MPSSEVEKDLERRVENLLKLCKTFKKEMGQELEGENSAAQQLDSHSRYSDLDILNEAVENLELVVDRARQLDEGENLDGSVISGTLATIESIKLGTLLKAAVNRQLSIVEEEFEREIKREIGRN